MSQTNKPIKAKDLWSIFFNDMILEEYYRQERWFSPQKKLRNSGFEHWTIFWDERTYEVGRNWSKREGNKWEVIVRRYGYGGKCNVWGDKRKLLKRFAITHRKNVYEES